MGKHQRLNNFEFYSDRLSATLWLWYFRPVGAPVFVSNQSVNRKSLLALLSTPSAAIDEYTCRLTAQANVPAAQAALSEAVTFKKKSSQPDWDPGGTTNNLGKVKRELDRARDIDFELHVKETRLQRAQELTALLLATPFDGSAWLRKNDPTAA